MPSLVNVRERLFVVSWISVKVVISCSSRIGSLLVTIFNDLSVFFTKDSHTPHNYRLDGGMKHHWILLIDNLSIFAFWSNLSYNIFSSQFASTDLWPLSLHICLALPRLVVILCSAIIKQSPLRSPASCKRIIC